MRSLLVSLALAGGFLVQVVSGFGCDSVDAAFDCQSVCSKYHDCYDSSYDVGGCRERCRAKSADDSTIRSKADTCESCISGMSCLPATFNCATSCGVIVP